MHKDRLIYRSEDPNKKLTRFMWWHAARRHNPKVFYEKEHLVLAGYGGDIAILTAMGVNQENIVAIDENKECIQHCEEKFPNVTYVRATMTPKHPTGPLLFEHGALATAMLDFCGAPVVNNLAIMKAVAPLVDRRGVIGCTFLLSRGSPDLKKLTAKAVKETKSNDPAVLRAHVVALMMSPEWYPSVAYEYDSRQENQTHPMVSMLFTQRKANLVRCATNTTDEEIKEAILVNDSPGFDAALMLNVPRTVVAGWKSHVSRRKNKLTRTIWKRPADSPSSYPPWMGGSPRRASCPRTGRDDHQPQGHGAL
jgi:hypothetical protein